jgi:adenylylsulfate kinase
MLVAMAGLPGSGKSTIACRLASELGAVVLNKDVVRAALFPPPVMDYSQEQGDAAMQAIYRAAAIILRGHPSQTVILDGRTFLRSYQVQDLLNLAASLNEEPHVIECVCSEEVARGRLERDRTHGEHPAANRTFELYLSVKASAEPITIPHATLDTGSLALQECVSRCLAHLRRG